MEVSNGFTPGTLKGGREVIKRYCVSMPGAPGVYRMINAAGEVLYVGKAKHLKKRVSSYLNVAAQGTRIQRMISQTSSMEIITTRSEAEALLLEANLIKKYTPRYNILLKDDKSFPFIYFSGDHPYPRLGKHRGAKLGKGKYFGPFVSGLAVNETLTLLEKAFHLRSCSDSIFKNRTRPCMLYQIKRCSAPCVGRISQEEYAQLVAQAQAFLSGKSRQIQEELVKEMQQLSLQMHYEKARVIRDRIQALTKVQHQGAITADSVGDADVIVLERMSGVACIQLFSFRGGRNYGNKSWFPERAAQYADGEVLRNFIGQYYQSHPVPPSIIISHMLKDAAVLEEALRLNNPYKIEIIHPLRGAKRDLIDLALNNAKQALVRHLSMHASQREVLAGVQELFGLEEPPGRIEVYDNSHIMGTNAVGAMIVAGPEGFHKSAYRKFNIKSPTTTPGDDYAMLREVLMRRFRKTQEGEEERKKNPLPDLMLIDGGAGQVSVAAKVLEEAGIHGLCFAGIAKGPDRNAGREQFFVPGKEPFQLPEGDPVLHYLQRLRDEAHRFAIGAHRNKRSNALRKSELDAIPFIGPGRKKALLLHFGSARDVAAASIDDLCRVQGISASMAKVIYEHFHGSH